MLLPVSRTLPAASGVTVWRPLTAGPPRRDVLTDRQDRMGSGRRFPLLRGAPGAFHLFSGLPLHAACSAVVPSVGKRGRFRNQGPTPAAVCHCCRRGRARDRRGSPPQQGQHQRNTGTVDVGGEQFRAKTASYKGQGQVDGDSGLILRFPRFCHQSSLLGWWPSSALDLRSVIGGIAPCLRPCPNPVPDRTGHGIPPYPVPCPVPQLDGIFVRLLLPSPC